MGSTSKTSLLVDPLQQWPTGGEILTSAALIPTELRAFQKVSTSRCNNTDWPLWTAIGVAESKRKLLSLFRPSNSSTILQSLCTIVRSPTPLPSLLSLLYSLLDNIEEDAIVLGGGGSTITSTILTLPEATASVNPTPVLPPSHPESITHASWGTTS